MTKKIIRRKALQALTGFGRTHTYNLEKAGLLPKPISLGDRAKGWPEDEIDAINKARIAGVTADEIRQLVIRLEAARFLESINDLLVKR